MTGRPSRLLLAMALTVASTGGCGSDDEQLTVFAASSLADVLPDLADAHRQAGGLDVVKVLAGSSRLGAQLRDGGQPGEQGGVGPPIPVAGNYMVVAVPAGNPGGVTGPHDLKRNDLRLAVCAAGVR